MDPIVMTGWILFCAVAALVLYVGMIAASLWIDQAMIAYEARKLIARLERTIQHALETGDMEPLIGLRVDMEALREKKARFTSRLRKHGLPR